MHRRRSFLAAPLAAPLVAALAISALTISRPAHAATGPTNPGFEQGLDGWTVVRGDAFSAASVTEQSSYWDRVDYGQSQLWHIVGGHDTTGTLESESFRLGDDGKLDALIGGTASNQCRLAVVNEAGAELGSLSSDGGEQYRRKSLDLSAHVGQVVSVRLIDESSECHLNVDDINVAPTPSLHSHVEPALFNHDFELADLHPQVIRGWTPTGEAFGPRSLVHDTTAGNGGPFNHSGHYHLWGFAAAGDDATGQLRSSVFTVSGNGYLDFLISGGRSEALSVTLHLASDGSELLRATGTDSEAYQRRLWDIRPWLGKEVYLQVTDDATGSWGHINLDDINAPSRWNDERIAHWSFDEGTGDVTLEEASGSADAVNYHLLEGSHQPPRAPLWRSDGIRGASLLFDGYSTWLERPASATPVPTKELTVDTWLAPRNWEHGDEGRLSAIVAQADREAKEGYLFGTYRHGAWGLEFGTGDAWHQLLSDQLLPLNEWSHITATYDSATGDINLYLNGRLSAHSHIDPGQEIRPHNGPLMVGRQEHGTWLYGFRLNMFSGVLDELTVSGEVMIAESVARHHEADIAALGGNLPTADVAISREELQADSERPQFHAAPPGHWQNEPSGPLWYDGQYHVFYQSNPRGPYWNHIRWGHLVSTDMVHWRDAADAVIPERHGNDPDGAWAGGSAIAGDGTPVIFYTAGDDRESPNQRIAMARSTVAIDGDRDLNSWEKGSIVVNQEAGQGIPGEFRDPFVFRDGNTWFMLVTSGIEGEGGTALVYSTTDPSLASGWTYRGPLFVGDYSAYPEAGRVWELPNLLPLGNGKWVFIINPAKMSRDEYQSRTTRYWIGSWDPAAARFTPDHLEPRLLDIGGHFTGPAGFVTPDGRSVLFSLAQGRRTAQIDAKSGWAHNMGLPIELSLGADGDLQYQPISELNALRQNPIVDLVDASMDEANAALAEFASDSYEVEVVLSSEEANEIGLSVRRTPDDAERTRIYYKRSEQEFTVDRTASTLNPDLEKGFHLARVPVDGGFTLRVFVDRSLIEAYLDGRQSITTRAYPTRSDAMGLQVWANDKASTVRVERLRVWPMTSAYERRSVTGVSLSGGSAQIQVGQPLHLSALIEPIEAADKFITWSSSDPKVATVVNGRIEGIAPGTATITAITRDGGHSATHEITVIPEAEHGDLPNHDFESGDLSGWTVEGDAFTDADVTSAISWGWGGSFLPSGSLHVWGAASGGDEQTGSLRSKTVILGGNGQIDFLIGGGNDPYRLRLEVVEADTGQVIGFRTGGNQEGYSRQTIDASAFLGHRVYVRIVDSATGGWGHLNVDDINVPVEG